MNIATDNTTDTSTDLVEIPADPAQAAAALALNNIKPESYVKQVFDPFKKQLAVAVRAAAKTPEFNIQTTAGMEVVKQLRRSFTSIRTGAENMRKERKAPIIQIGKLLDAEAEKIKVAILPHEDKYDALIKAEEARKEQVKQAELARERSRIEAIENRLQRLRSIPALHLQSSAADIHKAIDKHSTVALDPVDYEEFHEAALAAINASIVELQRMHTIAAQREAEAARVQAERAELERLRQAAVAEDNRRRAEEAKRLAEQQRLAEEQRQREAEAKAAAEAQARRIAELEAMLAAANAPKVDPVPQAAPGATPLEDRVPINSTGQYYSTTTFKDNGKPILCNADGSRSVFCDVDDDDDEDDAEPLAVIDDVTPYAVGAAPLAPASTIEETPSRDEVLRVLADHYDVHPDTVAAWLTGMDFTSI